MIVSPPPPLPAALLEAPTFVESRIEVGADRFEYQLIDVDGDTRVDLLAATIAPGERKLRLWKQRADASFPPAPDWQLAVPPDVVAFSLLDLREEAGRELLLMTRATLWSLSTTKEGLQGNVRRELDFAFFPDLPDPERLPCWRMVEDLDGDGKEELLAMSADGGLAVVAIEGSAQERQLRVRCHLGCYEEPARAARGSFSFGSGGVETRAGELGANPSLFPGGRSSKPTLTGAFLLERRRRFLLPRLEDFDGDGQFERIDVVNGRWQVAPALFETRRGEREAIVELPAGARDASERHWIDLDGDGRRELVSFSTDDDDKVALAWTSAPDPGQPLGAKIAETPSARVKLAGMNVGFALVDVDHDGRLDLTARVLDVPTGLSTLATVRLDSAFHVFRGGPGATWSKAPDFSFQRQFKPEQLARVQESLLLDLRGDFDGDKVNDLVTTQLDGRIEIRAVRRDGEQLQLIEPPFASFQPPAQVTRLETWDLSLDGVADLVLRHERAFTLFVSRAGAKR